MYTFTSKDITQWCDQLNQLTFSPPVTHVYNPLQYAGNQYVTYLQRYGSAPKKVVLLGMNPGPWGMAQTGIPFGEVNVVKTWLKICTPISKPQPEHPLRPVHGLSCPRSEVSGARLWGWLKSLYPDPEALFKDFFVANYCPLLFLEESGRNRTPDKLPLKERKPLFELCDHYLLKLVRALDPAWVIGIGKFAEKRARLVLGNTKVEIKGLLHPSPANPAANRGWHQQADKLLSLLHLDRSSTRG